MKHSKTTQKLENKLKKAIEQLEALANEDLEGFISISFTVKYDHFPNSLLVHCSFNDEDSLLNAKNSELKFQKKLHQLLFKQGILLKNSAHNLAFIKVEA